LHLTRWFKDVFTEPYSPDREKLSEQSQECLKSTSEFNYHRETGVEEDLRRREFEASRAHKTL